MAENALGAAGIGALGMRRKQRTARKDLTGMAREQQVELRRGVRDLRPHEVDQPAPAGPDREAGKLYCRVRRGACVGGRRTQEPGHHEDAGWRGGCLESPRDGEPCCGVRTTHNIGLTGR